MHVIIQRSGKCNTILDRYRCSFRTRQSYVTSCSLWPATREVVAGTKAYAVTVVLGATEKTPPKERILLEMQLVAAALDVLKSATTVVWPDANADLRSDLLPVHGARARAC
jgi:hypothetical protein